MTKYHTDFLLFEILILIFLEAENIVTELGNYGFKRYLVKDNWLELHSVDFNSLPANTCFKKLVFKENLTF